MAVPILSSQAQLQQWADRLEKDVAGKVESITAEALSAATRATQRVDPADFAVTAGAGVDQDVTGGSLTVAEDGDYEVETQACFNLSNTSWVFLGPKIGAAALVTADGVRMYAGPDGAGGSCSRSVRKTLTAGTVVKLVTSRTLAASAGMVHISLILRPVA